MDAGYSERTARGSSARLLANAGIRAALERLAADTRCAAIADASERKAFLTRVMRDNTESMPAHLRATELLAKMEGDFLESATPVTVTVSRPLVTI
ncbi:MAG: hypothetical protein IT472_08350 [Thermomonas sp.]|uniref:terminase small subunit n=1 Tax=Thermomonas sp. TaxID=1971895 RepID=UPI002627D98C|nr:terminase small subunit [Thermomonas sp.]MCC7097174.1 hypothetical protein [Thermomonas sp.]